MFTNIFYTIINPHPHRHYVPMCLSLCVCVYYRERKQGHLCLPLVDIDGVLLMLTNTIH